MPGYAETVAKLDLRSRSIFAVAFALTVCPKSRWSHDLDDLGQSDRRNMIRHFHGRMMVGRSGARWRWQDASHKND